MKLTYSLIFTGLVQFLAPALINHIPAAWQDVGRGVIAMASFLIVHIAGNSNPDGTPSFQAYGPLAPGNGATPNEAQQGRKETT